MEIYIVVVEDRHTDIEVHPFTDKNKAISEAKRVAKEYCRNEEYYEEQDLGEDVGFLFYAQYSCESDNVRVVTTTLNKEI